MAVTTIARIQHRRGVKSDLPANLNEGELGWCMDTRELFIGNTSAVGGNTQILTSSSNLANIAQYTFVSDTSVVSVTGPSAAQPVVRSLQNQIDDMWVNVKAYGAQGDGITDDTAAINRAIFDLYTKNLPLTENERQTRKAVWFPSGQYLISTPLLVYPFVRLVGENRDSTKIVLTGSDPLVAQPCVLKLVDSVGQQDSSIGNNGATLPTSITVDDLSLTTTQSLPISVLLLQRCTNILFRNCMVQGAWQNSTSVAQVTVGVNIETLGGAIATSNINFVDCIFANLVWGAYSTDEVSNLLFERCRFSNLFKGILTENRVAPNPNNGPNLTRVSSSLFEDIDNYGIQVMSPNPGIVAINNTYNNVGATSVVTPIFWDASSEFCASIGDRFDVSPSIVNLGTNNLIVNNNQSNLSAGSRIRNLRIPTGASPFTDTVQSTDDIIVVRTATDTVQLDLPAGENGRCLTIKDGENNASVNNITLQPAGSDSIDTGAASAPYVISVNNAAVNLCYDSVLATWHII